MNFQLSCNYPSKNRTCGILQIFFFAASILLIATSACFGQRINAEVVFHTDQLPKEEREYLEGVDRQLAEAINSHKWIEKGYNYELPLRIEIIFEKYSISAAYRRYGAGILVANRSGVQLRDSRWDFRYSHSFPFQFGRPDDPMTSIIEFYTWIVLGFELDKYSPLGGQQYFDKAHLIAENARFEINYVRGWDYRRDFIRDLMLDKYRDVRTASFHAAAGIYYTERGKMKSARSHLAQAAELIMASKPEHVILHRDDHIIRFVNISEFIEALDRAGAYDIMEQLADWDPDNPEIKH